MPVNYTPTFHKIDFTGGDISVRGISIPEISQLVATHTDAAVTLWNEFSKLGDQEISLNVLIFGVLQRFQSAITHMLALAADAPDEYDTIARLPIDVQVEAILKVAELSFAMDGGAKKFWETVAALVRANAGLLEKANPILRASMNGSGTSAAS